MNKYRATRYYGGHKAKRNHAEKQTECSHTMIGRENIGSSGDMRPALSLVDRDTRVWGDGKNLVYQLHMYIRTHKYFYVCINTHTHSRRLTRKQFTVNNSFSNCPVVFGIVSRRVHVLPMPHQNIAMPHRWGLRPTLGMTALVDKRISSEGEQFSKSR